jgi:hypothetical protein
MLVVAVGITGLELLGVAAWVNDVFNGAVLIVAVTVSMLASRRERRGFGSRLFSGRVSRRRQPEASGANVAATDGAGADKTVSGTRV